MKANFIKLETPTEGAFLVRKDNRVRFDDKWHFHGMLELVVILEGDGKRYIGDSIETFTKGDVILVGENLPHVWRSNPITLNSTLKKKCEAIVIQFSADFIGENFLALPESTLLAKLFKEAEKGISFQNKTRKKMITEVSKLLKLKGMDRLLHFLNILNLASKSSEIKTLASPLFSDVVFKRDVKINKVFEYIMDNFSNPITLDEIAKIVSMNKTAFCRYFKKRTKKTFSSFLNEIRIGYACKLIREEKHNITEAAYLSGYNSPSHFHKQFRLIKKISPTEFYKNSIGITD